MIDTIVLTIPKDRYIILDHNKFSPPTIGLFESSYYMLGKRGNFKCVQNPTKSELLNKIYKPRLTITKRIRKGYFEIPLRIEFSIPKLAYGNNFDEVKEDDFELVINKLKKVLFGMAVDIDEKDLINAKVSAIHYSKNIALTDYTSCSMVIKELSKINLTKRLDLNKTSFRNEGEAIYFHCNSYEITVYDKLKDLEKAKISEKRSTESDNIIQLNLFDDIKIRKPFEVLRIEVRLNSISKIKSLLKELNINTEPTFINLFRKDISKKIICHFWKDIEEKAYILRIDTRKPSYLFEEILKKNPDISLSKALKLLSCIIIIKEIGVRGFRILIETNSKNKKFWYNLNKELKLLNLSTIEKYNPISEVSSCINSFKPLRLKDYF